MLCIEMVKKWALYGVETTIMDEDLEDPENPGAPVTPSSSAFTAV